jgi:hypothetical protein
MLIGRMKKTYFRRKLPFMLSCSCFDFSFGYVCQLIKINFLGLQQEFRFNAFDYFVCFMVAPRKQTNLNQIENGDNSVQ